MSWLEHHKISETRAESAQSALNDGRRQDALRLYAEAARAEEAALDALDPSKARTLGVTAVSAVALYCKGGDYTQATALALKWLAHDGLPPFAQQQLRVALRTVSREAGWAGPTDAIGEYICTEFNSALKVYREQPSRAEEDARHERETARGGYANRQIVELAQNAADQVATAGSKVCFVLEQDCLYIADDGCPIDKSGVRALLYSHLSPKPDHTIAEIGRFGVGFKSVLGVTDSPYFFSRTGSFCFDRHWSTERIAKVAPNAQSYPVLRLANPIDPIEEAQTDNTLASLMSWATNIVRLPLKTGSHPTLIKQISEFPSEFLLFVPHVKLLGFAASGRSTLHRQISISKTDNDAYQIADGDKLTQWKVFSNTHDLTTEAITDHGSPDDSGRAQIRIQWAVPLKNREDRYGCFWAFFPTQTKTTIRGIFNAPWKTPNDRQNLLPGIYNNEIIDAAAKLVASSLPYLSDPSDPAIHLDFLGGRIDNTHNDHTVRLANSTYAALHEAAVIPDVHGDMTSIRNISLPPSFDRTHSGSNIEANIKERILNIWYEYPNKPSNWLHRQALRGDRPAIIDRIFQSSGRQASGAAPRATEAEWLESLKQTSSIVEDAVSVSRSAIRIAALLWSTYHPYFGKPNVGAIVLMANGSWANPRTDTIYFGGAAGQRVANLVHPELGFDTELLESLKDLGVKPITRADELRNFVSILSKGEDEMIEADERWRDIWKIARSMEPQDVIEAVSPSDMRMLTISGKWRTRDLVLLPGPVVPADGSRDADIAIDLNFHRFDNTLIKGLGAQEGPISGFRGQSKLEFSYINECISDYHMNIDGRPQWGKLQFESPPRIGPLDLFGKLSDVAQAKFTDLLLRMDDTYSTWTLAHSTQSKYEKGQYQSLALWCVRKYGRVQTKSGTCQLVDGLGEQPKSVVVQKWLLEHSQTNSIRKSFSDLKSTFDGEIEFIGRDEDALLTDEWPGLQSMLTPDHPSKLVRCDRMSMSDGSEVPIQCSRIGDVIFLVRQKRDDQELRFLIKELLLQVDPSDFERILARETSDDLRAEREKIRACSTDAERLLAAVGGENLCTRLPSNLIAVLNHESGAFADIRIAEAAIATYHTGALREYRCYLYRLGPPLQWAGGRAAVEFVTDLGFGPDWAGQPGMRRSPREEVTGPHELPSAHPYQRRAIRNLRELLHAPRDDGENRGLLSLPTGSGKTRVAVQAIIEAVKEDDFRGPVLWIAGQDELCEQAVESWRQAWAAIGPKAENLRISRMWRGHDRPVATDSMHVIVATWQTLGRRGVRSPSVNDPLNHVSLLVIDEAHGSIAPTFTSIMRDLGLTYRRHEDEICLIGLTATPYKGRDKDETSRLASRYGRNRLDRGAFEHDDPEKVVRQLQSMGVLASVDHRTIVGADIQFDDLNEEERTRLHHRRDEDAPWLPESVERRIANDIERTRRIVAAYKELVDQKWPTLIFATSVEHAKTLAALLQLGGVEARAISAETPGSTRRSIVERFRMGDLTVLVNYGVLREGFDAPNTRALIVARPVYSPNLYFQMIGRGLRGKLNGGSARCLILDVEDNVESYQRKLAFSELDNLWS